MIDKVLSSLAPHYCYDCGEIGSVLCDYCSNNITQEPYDRCIECGMPTPGGGWHASCRLPYEKAWCVARRSGAIERLIDAYKFGYNKAAHEALAKLLYVTLPKLPSNTVIVPIPTIAKHVRQRGYDHIDLICKSLSKQSNLKTIRLLKRRNDTVQHGATKQQRIDQAAVAFVGSERLSLDTPYLLVDDIATTGSTLRYAAKELRRSGAECVWVAVIARQTIDS